MKLYFSRTVWPKIQDKFVQAGHCSVPYNGRLLWFGGLVACIEFPTKEDAIMFKLVYGYGYGCSND